MGVTEYLIGGERSPFAERMQTVQDARAVARIGAAVDKMRHGLFGDWKAVGNGVLETRIDFGPGYRIYYAKDGDALVILLLCGDKRTQNKDIEVAHGYWKDYKTRKQAVQRGRLSAQR